MNEPFSAIQIRNAKALLRDICNDIKFIPFEEDRRSELEHGCDIIIKRMCVARLPEIFTANLINTVSRKTVASLLETVLLLENKIKEVEKMTC